MEPRLYCITMQARCLAAADERRNVLCQLLRNTIMINRNWKSLQ